MLYLEGFYDYISAFRIHNYIHVFDLSIHFPHYKRLQNYTLKMQTLNINVDASNTVGIFAVMLNKGP